MRRSSISKLEKMHKEEAKVGDKEGILAGKSLVQGETREIGSVSTKTYKSYMKAGT